MVCASKDIFDRFHYGSSDEISQIFIKSGMGKKYENYTRDELVCEICRLKSCKKFGLVWEDKPEDVAIQCEERLPVLRERDDLSINCIPDGQDNYIIEGDNYHALSVLNYTHTGKIDIIYIDPPYNTGNKDFLYNDKYVDLEDTYRHSKWLSFMEKRLRLAKNLLSDSGVIFISIDDNEQAHLKLLCDEIFGEDNFVSTLNIETSVIAGPRRVPAIQGCIVKTSEYVLCYIKNSDKHIFKNCLLYDYNDGFDEHYSLFYDNKEKKFIPFKEFLKKSQHFKSIFEKYGLQVNYKNLSKIIKFDDSFKQIIYQDKITEHLYRKSDDNIEVDNNILKKWEKNVVYQYNNKYCCIDNDGTIKTLFRYKDKLGFADDYFNNFGERTVRGNLWKGFSSDGGNLAKEGGVNFKNGKKPVRLIRQLLKGSSSKNSIILDFFAGSGTTGQAVLELNKEDGGTRQFILCTNNENNIAQTITYPRIKTVVTGIRLDGSKYSDGLPANVKYLVADDFVSKSASIVQLKVNLTKKCTTMLCLKEDCFNKIESVKDKYAFYTNNAKNKTICIFYGFSDDTIDEFIEKVRNIRGHKVLYVFSLDEIVDNRMFKGITDYTIEPVPQKIMEIYRRIHKKVNK